MARSSTPAPSGQNKPRLTDDEFEDLKAFYSQKIRAQQNVAEQKKAEAKAESDEVNALFKRMAADLRYTRKDFQEYLTDLARPRAEFRQREEARRRLYAHSALDTQFSLELKPDTVDDQAEAEAEGRRAYLANEDPKPPKHVSSILHPAWMKGWQAEQTITAERMGRAETFLAKRAKPDASAAPVDLNGSAAAVAEPPSVPDPAEVEKQARALRRSGFTKRSSAGAGQAQAAA